MNKNKAYLYYWQRQATDASDHTLNEMLGNELMNTYEYDAYIGRVNTISITKETKYIALIH